jgi:hypothetical protein
MQKDELMAVLNDLYNWNPKLKDKEEEIIKLINLMVEVKPDTKFDSSFANSLKKDLLSHRILIEEETSLNSFSNNILNNLKNMNKKFYVLGGSLATLGIVALVFIFNSLPTENKTVFTGMVKNNDLEAQFVKSAPNSFGSLASLSSTGTNSLTSQSGGATEMLATDSRVAVSAVAPVVGLGGGDAVSSKMIMPMRSYQYVYKGESLELAETSANIYRRLKGDGRLSSSLDSLINTKAFGQINLSSFSNLKTSNISLLEDKPLGLSINIDFNEETIYIGENWLKWQSDRNNCGDNQACWDSYRLKIDQVPADEDLIAKTNKFLEDKGINLDHYDAPIADNQWRLNYETSTDKTNYYIPEYANVVYPLKIEDQIVYDQSGNLEGLRVSVNLLHNAVSGVSNLTSYRFETSAYDLETDSARIISLAEKGGYGSGFYYLNEAQDKTVLELGTPTKSLIRFWRYANNTNEELFIPALIFPIINTPSDYYGSRYITVPLAQEMVAELEKNSNGGGYDGGIMPMLR